jgi:hypothetical protein
MISLGGCAGHGVKLFQGNHMTSLSFPRGPYDIIIIKWGWGVLQYITLYCILYLALTQLFVLWGPLLSWAFTCIPTFGGPEIVKDVWSYYDSLLINLNLVLVVLFWKSKVVFVEHWTSNTIVNCCTLSCPLQEWTSDIYI